MRNSIFLAAALLGMALASGTAAAADNGFYLGASIGQSNVDVDAGPVRINGDDTGFKIIAGFRPLDYFAVEVNYVDFGKVEDNGFKAESDAISAYAVGFLPVGPVDLFAKAGLVNSDTSLKGTIEAPMGDSTDFSYGVGVQFRLLSLSARVEYEVYDGDNVNDLNMVSVGLTYTFF
ncbi:MAG TPA: outer membrane beta-barrel protein [Povalibacter sp.]|nr:outer membrane beta-barrel protein [Povalibacter sp.]